MHIYIKIIKKQTLLIWIRSPSFKRLPSGKPTFSFDIHIVRISFADASSYLAHASKH